MMSQKILIPACALVAALAACTAQEETAPVDVETRNEKHFSSTAFFATGKPGAGVSFGHSLRAPVQPGGDGVLQLTINEIYKNGELRLEASSESLDLAVASRSKALSMDGGAAHQWDLYFDAPDAGVYYIDITATVNDGAGAVMTRSYSAAVKVGEGAALAKTSADVTRDTAGVPINVMQAEETIGE